MKIDRTRFLLLTATIAATTAVAGVVMTTGCAQQTTETDGGSNDTDSGSTDTDSGDTGDGGTNADASEAGACLGGSVDEGTLCAPAEEGADAAADPKCPTECATYSSRFKSEVAKAINDCLNSAPTCEGNEVPCATAAIEKACPDPDAETFCTDALAQCADAGGTTVSQSACVAVISATTATGKGVFTTCTTEGADCAACLDSLKNGF